MQKQMTLSNGARIRELRESASMTQEKLGHMSNVDRRTVQRAERGSRLQMETLSSLAAALDVPVTQIVTVDVPSNNVDDLNAKSLVVLNRIRSGMTLLNIVRESFEGTIACEADPTSENVEAMTAVVERLEELMPQPWISPHNQVQLALSERIRIAVTIGDYLMQLEEQGIAFFAGTYTARTQLPLYDADTMEMIIFGHSPFELVTICRVVVVPLSQGERITIKANDIYIPSKAPVFDARDELQANANRTDEDIPF